MVLEFPFFPLRFGSFFWNYFKIFVKLLRKKNIKPQFEIDEKTFND